MQLMTYDNYIYRLSTAAPQTVYTVDLPKDLIWSDELTWQKVEQEMKYSLTGALLIQEGVKQKGRFITFTASSNMAWLTRSQGTTLMSMRDTPGLVMTLKFLDSTQPANVLFSYNTMFRNFEDKPLDIENIKDFDQFESTAWYIVKSIKLMETLAYGEM
jgi:hypothetical protein